jgi:glycosyltransferase involved in cell wall biosynthesis
MYRPELIYTTAGPFSTHVAGFILHEIFRIPWLAEMHDPLIYDKEKHKWQMYLFKKWLEKRIFRNASAIIYFTEKALANAVGRNQMKGRGYVLRPGAEPPDISGIRYKKRDKIHFGHFGSLAEDRSLKVVIQAFYELLKKSPDLNCRVCLNIYGSELDPVSLKFLSKYPLNGILRQHGRLEFDPLTNKSGRQRVMEAMRQSDVLILIHGEGMMCQEYIPSKLYEYLLTHRPILGLIEPNSELETFLINGGHFVTPGNDVRGVKNILAELIERWESDQLADRAEGSPFTVESAVNNLFSIVKTIA